MKKWSLCLFMLAFTVAGFAQETGMHFEHNTTWEKVLAKAKAENKYIFVDCFTTWCGPCKQMSKNVFPQETVGNFFNDKYINVKVQLDTTGKDNEEVQSWFAAGKKLATEYNVQAYPTYLFFDPNGTIVHRAAGSSEAEKFISKGQDALNPEKQYYTLKRRYEGGERDEKMMYSLAKVAGEAYDPPFSKDFMGTYLATQKDLLTNENILFVAYNLVSSKSVGFKEMLEHPEAFDKVIGKDFSSSMIKQIIASEEVEPLTSSNGQNSTTVPDWNGILQKASAKYPKYAPEVVTYSKVLYYQQKRDWKNFGTAVSDYMKAFGSNATPAQMNNFAWTVFENCNDMACVANALAWSKQSFADNNSPMFMDTYANLLYKAGKKKEAIEWETKAMTQAKTNKEDTGEYQTTLNKMTKGEKTW